MRGAIEKNRVGVRQMELMKAIRIHNYSGPEVLQYEDAPSPKPAPGDVLIRIHAAGVNPADWKVREVHLKQFVQNKFPLIPGWDASGVVEEVGPDVSQFKKGDEVFSKPDGSRDGAYAEYVVVGESEVALKPKSLHHVYAAAVPLAGTTAWLAEGRRAHELSQSGRARGKIRSAGEAMITMSILWALVIRLFAINRERANERR